jgi:plasmid stabilization system protein ParE
MRVVISQRAEEDLARIYAYIAVRNAEAAERFKTQAEKP